MKTVKARRGVCIGPGNDLAAGDIAKIDEATAVFLVSIGAVEVIETPVITDTPAIVDAPAIFDGPATESTKAEAGAEPEPAKRRASKI